MDYDEILKLALKHDLTNVFEVISWWSCGTTSDEIVATLEGRLKASRSLFV